MTMAEHDHSAIKEEMNVVGADGVHIGTVDHLEGERIKLTKADSGDGKHHYLPAGLVAAVEGDTVRLSANAANAVDLFEEARSEEHTSDLQSLMRISYAVVCLKKQ